MNPNIKRGLTVGASAITLFVVSWAVLIAFHPLREGPFLGFLFFCSWIPVLPAALGIAAFLYIAVGVTQQLRERQD